MRCRPPRRAQALHFLWWARAEQLTQPQLHNVRRQHAGVELPTLVLALEVLEAAHGAAGDAVDEPVEHGQGERGPAGRGGDEK